MCGKSIKRVSKARYFRRHTFENVHSVVLTEKYTVSCTIQLETFVLAILAGNAGTRQHGLFLIQDNLPTVTKCVQNAHSIKKS